MEGKEVNYCRGDKKSFFTRCFGYSFLTTNLFLALKLT
jgi:hypothetical protein